MSENRKVIVLLLFARVTSEKLYLESRLITGGTICVQEQLVGLYEEIVSD